MIGSLAYCILGTLLLGAVAQDTAAQIGVNDSLWYPYDETLLLKPLPNNDLLLSFTFQLQSEPFDPAVSSQSFDAYESVSYTHLLLSSIRYHLLSAR